MHLLLRFCQICPAGGTGGNTHHQACDQADEHTAGTHSAYSKAIGGIGLQYGHVYNIN